MSNSSQEGLHILFFPYPAQGHMLPMLEEEYWDQLRNVMGQGHVWSVGPLYLLGGERTLGRVNPDVDLSGGVTGWLDGCPDGSVLYVCFGSQKLLESNQMKALASGLERSWVRFICVVKLPVIQHGEHGRGVVPDEFEDRVSGKGLVIKGWAPQVSILTHRAVGGFLSHCGWNSVLEGITAGVVIPSWPMEGDQFVNARLLVEDLGTAVGVCEGADAMPDSEELAQTIINSMSRDIPQRFRVEELRVKALEAVEVGGEFLKGFGWACERVGPSSREEHG